jgi:hypothetical protein
MKSPSRVYTASHIASGVKTVAALQQKVLSLVPHKFGPMSALQTPDQKEEEKELMTAHCLGCGSKKEFAVEGKETMKNGATRAFGKCNGGCGRTISTFVKGASNGE